MFHCLTGTGAQVSATDGLLSALAAEYAHGSIRESEDGNALFSHLMGNFHKMLEASNLAVAVSSSSYQMAVAA